MGKLLQLSWDEFYGGDFDIGVDCAGIHISGRAYLAIYNEVLQFFLIVMGFIPLVYLGLEMLAGGTD